jgi:hypothetical protein
MLARLTGEWWLGWSCSGSGSVHAGAEPRLVTRHLETLALMGEATQDAEGRYERLQRQA